MKAATRLSKFVLFTSSSLLIASSAVAQSDWQEPSFQRQRAPWETQTSGSIPSAEYGSPDADARSVFEPGIRREAASVRPASGTISIARLKSRPPAKAQKEMNKATKLVAEGEREEAIGHYERAIELFPSYVEAYNNLGVQCIKLGRTNEAIGALERAVQLDAGSVEPHLNLAVALHKAGQLDAAAFQAERAVEIAPQSASANLGLGLVLTAQGRKLEEAVRRLQFASAEHPGAALAAADALLQLNRPKDAQTVLRSFLSRSSMGVQ